MINPTINPRLLEGWVAVLGKPTDVIQPCYVDEKSPELRDWHPGFDAKPHSFMHLAGSDASGVYACADKASFSANFTAEMKKVMLALKLRPFPIDIGPAPMLIDEEIGQVDTPLMLDWKVIGWTVVKNVVKNLDNQDEEVHQDLITWKHTKNGTVVKSMFTWRPYLVVVQPLEKQSLQGLTRNERASVEIAQTV